MCPLPPSNLMTFIEFVTYRNSAWSFVKNDTLLKALAVTDVDFSLNIKEMLKIECTFAVTSAKCESSIVATSIVGK